MNLFQNLEKFRNPILRAKYKLMNMKKILITNQKSIKNERELSINLYSDPV